jgi:glycosyltransferase involved in cell wall biosynthesis
MIPIEGGPKQRKVILMPADSATLRILHVTTELTWRGGENQIRLLLQGLEKFPEVECFLAAPFGAQALGRMAAWVPTLPLPSRRPWDLRNILALRTFCMQNEIQVLDAHSAGAMTLALATKILRPQLKVVVHRRVDIPPRKNFFSRRKYLSPKIDSFVAISRAVEATLLGAGVPPHKIRVVPSAVDESVYSSISRSEAREKLLKVGRRPAHTVLLGNASALTLEKGHRDFLAALSLMRNQALPFHAFLAGSGPDEGQLRALTQDLGLAAHVTFMGFVTNVPEFLSGLDILCMPSHQEGLGTLVQDALYAGCAVCATRTGGLPEMVLDRQTGLLVEPGDSLALSRALTLLASDVDLRARCVTSGQKHLRQNFSLSGMVSGNLEVYKALMEKTT